MHTMLVSDEFLLWPVLCAFVVVFLYQGLCLEKSRE